MLDNSDPLSHLTHQVYEVDTTVPAYVQEFRL